MHAPTWWGSLAVAASALFLLLPSTVHSQALTCTAPENAVGSIDWPAPCPFGTLPVRRSIALDGLPSGHTVTRRIELPPGTYDRAPGGTLGGEIVTWTGKLNITLTNPHNGAVLERSLPMTAEVHTGRSSAPGADVQTFDTEMVSLSAALRGDPDFQTLRITRSSGGAGKTSLVRLPTSDFQVDSFFDITYRIEFQGAGPDWSGISGTVEDEVTMRQTLRCFNGVCYSPLGEAVTLQSEDELRVGNLGSSGLDGVRVSVAGNGLVDGIALEVQGASLRNDSAVMHVESYPPPQRLAAPGTPASVTCSTVGTLVRGVCDWGDLNASGTRVEVWNGDMLQAVTTVPNGGVCFTSPAQGFDVSSVLVTGKGDIYGVRRTEQYVISAQTWILRGPNEFTLTGASTPVVGTQVRFTAREAQNPPGGVSEVRLTAAHPWPDPCDLCIVTLMVTQDGLCHVGGGGSVMEVSDAGEILFDGFAGGFRGPPCWRKGKKETKTHILPAANNIPSRGRVDLGGGGLDVEQSLATGGSGAGGVLRFDALTIDDLCRGRVEYVGGGGAGGTIRVDYTGNGASTCRLEVYDRGALVGGVDVPLPVAGLNDVCGVTAGPNGHPRVRGCEKLPGDPPWDLPCWVLRVDRPTDFAPAGVAPLRGDEIRLIAPDAPAGAFDDVYFLAVDSEVDAPRFCPVRWPDPPVPVLSQAEFELLDFPGEYCELHQEQPATLPGPPQAAPTGALRIETEMISMSLKGQGPQIKTYAATLRLHLIGVGDRAGYSRVLDIAGSFEMVEQPNAFPNEEVQQIMTQVRNFSFEMPPGGDPDFDVLSILGGEQHGLPSPGKTIVHRIDGGHWSIDSFFDITYQIEFQGTAAGPLAGFTGLEQITRQWTFVRPATLFHGLPHHATGGATLDASSGRLVVSNLGSSGEDGVSIDLPDAQGFSMEFDPASPLTLAISGVLEFSERGLSPGAIAGIAIGSVVCTNRVDAFFDISYDYSSSSPGSTTAQVFNKGALVGQYQFPSADGRVLFLDDDGTGLPPIKGCGKIPGLGETPCNFIRFCGTKTVQVPGQPDLRGDEVRLLANGVAFSGITNFDLRVAGAAGDLVIVDQGVTKFGRELSGRGEALFTSEGGTAFDNGLLRVANLGSSGLDGVTVRPPRDAASGLPTGKRQHKPINVSTPDLDLGSFGASVEIEATGTIGGETGRSFGKAIAVSSGDRVALTGDFGGRGGGVIRVRLYEDDGKEGANPLYEGRFAGEGTASNGAPLCYLRYKLDRAFIKSWSAAPAAGNEPDRYTLVFGQNVSVELADGTLTVPHATRVEIAILAPTFPAEDLDSFTLRGANLKPFTIDRIGTGPVFASGLPSLSEGSAQIANSPTGQLVVSNLGWSGLDGVSINIGTADGAVVRPEVPLILGNNENWDFGSRQGDDRTFDTEIVSLSLRGTSSPTGTAAVDVEHHVFRQDFGPVQGNRRVFGFDGGGNLVGEVEVSSEAIGQLNSTVPIEIVSLSLAPAQYLPGSGLIPCALAVELKEDTDFAPAGGHPPFAGRVRKLLVGSAAAAVPERRVKRLRISTNTPGPVTLETSLLHFGHEIAPPVSGVCPGGTRVWPSGGFLRIENEGVCDFPILGISTTDPNGRGRIGPINIKPIRLEIGVQAPAGDVGTLKLEQFAINGNSCGIAEIDFVEVAGKGSEGVALRADFSAMGTQYANLEVRLDGAPVGEVRVRNGEVGRIRRASIAQPSLLSTGGEADTTVPGAVRAEGYSFAFDRPVAVIPTGTGPQNALVGNEIWIRPQGSTVTVPALSRFTLASNLDEYELTGIARKSFGLFLLEHFTTEEIQDLLATDFDLDHDFDGTNAIQEFARGTFPTSWDPGEDSPSSSVAGSPDGTKRLRWSYVIAPVEGVEIRMRSSEDLETFDEDPSQWTLVGRQSLPEGRVRLTWEMNEPLGGIRGDKKHQHHGHVTVLK